jgi:hypothetical protein
LRLRAPALLARLEQACHVRMALQLRDIKPCCE